MISDLEALLNAVNSFASKFKFPSSTYENGEGLTIINQYVDTPITYFGKLFTECLFDASVLRSMTFDNCTFHKCVFRDTELIDVNFMSSTFTECKIIDMQIEEFYRAPNSCPVIGFDSLLIRPDFTNFPLSVNQYCTPAVKNPINLDKIDVPATPIPPNSMGMLFDGYSWFYEIVNNVKPEEIVPMIRQYQSLAGDPAAEDEFWTEVALQRPDP